MNKKIFIVTLIVVSLFLLGSVVTAQQQLAATSTSPGWWTFPPSPEPTVSPGVTAFPFTPETKMELHDHELAAFKNMSVGDSLPAVFNLPPAYHGQSLVWTSSNNNVASVNVPHILKKSHMALIVANNPGTAVIRVSTADGQFSYSFDVVVR